MVVSHQIGYRKVERIPAATDNNTSKHYFMTRWNWFGILIAAEWSASRGTFDRVAFNPLIWPVKYFLLLVDLCLSARSLLWRCIPPQCTRVEMKHEQTQMRCFRWSTRITWWQYADSNGPRLAMNEVKLRNFSISPSAMRKYRIILLLFQRPGLFFMVSALIFNCCFLNTSSNSSGSWKVAQIYLNDQRVVVVVFAVSVVPSDDRPSPSQHSFDFST